MLVICIIGGFAFARPTFAEDQKDTPIVSEKNDQEIKADSDAKNDKNSSQAPHEEPKVEEKSDPKQEEPKSDDKTTSDEEIKTPETSTEAPSDNANDYKSEVILDNKTTENTDEKVTVDNNENEDEESSSDTTRTSSPENIDPEQVYLDSYLKLRTNTYTIYFPKDLREGIISIKEREKYGLDFALENVYTINNIWGESIYRYPADIKSAPDDFSDYWQAMLDTLIETPGTEQEGEASIYGSKSYQWRHAEFLLNITPKGELIPLKTINIEDKSFKLPEDKKEDQSTTKTEIKTDTKTEIKAEGKTDKKDLEKPENAKPKTKKVPISDQPIIKVRLSIYSTDADGIFYTVIFFRYDDLPSDDTDKTVKEIIGSFTTVSKEY